jgi:putative ABC transport system permease protein
MRALERKMFRDLWAMRGQGLAIIFVILSGVAAYVSMTSVMDALEQTLDTYYAEYRFADGFASVRRAPQQLVERLRMVPGVNHIETRVMARVNLEIPDFDEPVSGTIVSVPEGYQPTLNQLFIREGRFIQAGREDEVLLNEPFAQAHDLNPGDQLAAIINGRRKVLKIVGIALSPEFLIQIEPGSIFPDPERYGVMWMGRTGLEAAYDMDGAFNDLAFSLSPVTDKYEDVLKLIDDLLKPYGGQGAYWRADQPSHFIITEEFRQLRGTATVLPIIFLAVAAFLLNIVVTRLISLQREQIAVLKAFGYSNTHVGFHYVKLVLLISFIGTAAGIVLGVWMGRGLGNLYLEYYRFPYLEYTLRLSVAFIAVALTTGTPLIGVVQAVRKAVKLPPAEAMRPAPPAEYRATLVERLGLQQYFDQPTRMILRNLERRPSKALLTVIGMSSSCAILIMGLFFSDSFDYVINVQFGLTQREHLTVTFTEPTSTAALYEIKSLPGVLYAEPFRNVPVRLRYAHRSYQTGIEGIPQDAYLRRLIDIDLEPVSVPHEGIIITERLAQILHVRPGDKIAVEVLEGNRITRNVPMVGITRQFIGIGAYMDLQTVNRLAGLGRAISGVFLLIDKSYERKLVRILTDRPRVASIASQERVIESFYESTAKTMLIYTFILSLFAGVIAFGVVYNSARISLSERDRELASLRVLGFTRGEIAYILIGELAFLTLLSIPVGFVLGATASAGVVKSLQTDMYQLPFVLGGNTLSLAAVIVLAASVVSSLIIYRRLHKLDLIAVLKTRE